MDRIARASVVFLAVCASLAALLVPAGVAAAATQCGDRVVEDWSDNARIDRLYSLHCYEDAIASVPSDLRDYTDVTDVIERALTAAVRGGSPPDGSPGSSSPPVAAGAVPQLDSSASALPLPLLVLGGTALLVLAAGTLAYLARRRHPVHPDESDDPTPA